MNFDRIILGAGLYGLYAALFCAKQAERVLVLEYDPRPFMRATYINQARVHMGYHYPRSYSTAIKSAGYFRRFTEEYGFCIHTAFTKIYATSRAFSWTNARQFRRFCENAGIFCEEIPSGRYFQDGLCDGAFLTREYTYDAEILKNYLLDELRRFPSVTLLCGARIERMAREETCYAVSLSDGTTHRTPFLLNASYASANQLIRRVEGAGALPLFGIKYELCEIILCDVSAPLRETGITVMDGPFFSIMPFGKTGLHSLTSVTFTPHVTSYEELPRFSCQERSRGACTPMQLGNCNSCPARPASAWDYMAALARKYLREAYAFSYRGSLFSMKPILQTSELDDSRPTVVRVLTEAPTLVSVLSGKINTVYDLDEVLKK